MTGGVKGGPGRRRFLTSALLLGGVLAVGIHIAEAHNNPGFKGVLLVTVEVSAQPIAGAPLSAHSEPFGLDLPKKTIELIWRIAGAGAGVTFAVAQGDALHAEGLSDGTNSRILRGDDVRIVDVEGATEPFMVEIYANVIDRSKPAGS